MTETNWIDYGHWKNWESPWGEISLEDRPNYCNRGRVVFKLDTRGAVNFILEPLLSNVYFFDEKRALKHLDSAIALAEQLTSEQLRSLKNNGVHTPVKTFQGKDCFCYLLETRVNPGDFSLFIFAVDVDPAKQETFLVDWADRFPRFYLDLALATAEMNDWLICRKQYVGSDRLL